ncbi:MAG: hypothetical protein AB7H96_08840 [Vicinamibacterales bacterium]
MSTIVGLGIDLEITRLEAMLDRDGALVTSTRSAPGTHGSPSLNPNRWRSPR